MGESAGKAAARSGQNFSGVEDDLRGHPEKMTCHEPGNFDPRLRFESYQFKNSELLFTTEFKR